MKPGKVTRILIVGGSGFVGSTLARSFAALPDFEVVSTYHNDYTIEKGLRYVRLTRLDDKDTTKALVQNIEPNVIIYCVGSNELSASEPDQNLRPTQLAHSVGATHFLTASDFVKAKFIYISNDYVFSGIDGNNREDSTGIPAFTLGKSKLGAENYVRSRSLNHLVIRCAPLLGRGTIDHPSWIDQIREASVFGKKLKLPNKSIHNPVHIRFLVEVIKESLKKDLKNTTLHVGGLSRVSLFECAQVFANQFNFDLSVLEPSDASSQSMPSDYSLNFTETLKILGVEPLLLEQSFELLK